MLRAKPPGFRFKPSAEPGEFGVETAGPGLVEDEGSEVAFELGAGWNGTPGRDGEDLVGAGLGQAEFAGLACEAGSELGGPVGQVGGRFDVMAGDPGQPFVDLALVTPGFGRNDVEDGFDVDDEVTGVGAGHVSVVGVEDDGGLDPGGLRFVRYRELAEEGVGNVDHVGDPPDGLGDGEVIGMDAGEGIRWEGRAEQVVGLELADGAPEAGEEVGGQGAAGFLEGQAVGFTEEFELIVKIRLIITLECPINDCCVFEKFSLS